MPIYKYNPETGELDCISDRNGKLRPPVFMPKDTIHSGAHFENLGDIVVKNKDHKREVMKQQGVVEA